MFSEHSLSFLIPVVALLIPIVRMLTLHQQKMAEILHANHNAGQLEARVVALQQELASLKEVVSTQTLALDSMQGQLDAASRLNDRLTTSI